MQTDAPDFMDLFERLFCEGTSDTERQKFGDTDSTLEAPMLPLSEPPARLSELIGDQTMLVQFLEWYEKTHAPDRAKELAELKELIEANDADYFLGGRPRKRLLDFVYPVV